MRVCFEQVDSKEEELTLIRAVEKNVDILTAIDLLENGSGGIRGTKNGNTYICKLSQIYYVESVDKRTFIYTRDDCFECQGRLYEMENRLGRDFVRISKSMIVNLHKIRNVSTWAGARMIAVLLNGEQVVISRSYVNGLKIRMGLQ